MTQSFNEGYVGYYSGCNNNTSIVCNIYRTVHILLMISTLIIFVLYIVTR